MKRLKQNSINRIAASNRMANERFPPFATIADIEEEGEQYA
ncbi:hypothetical protein [Brevibacillus brevis]|nr:hypothetical protein [Brevibacillus brevis]